MALVATDADLTISMWNAAAARTFGAAAGRMIGTPVTHIFPQERRLEAERLLRKVIATGETIELEFSQRDPQGARRELAGTMAPVVAGSGERIGASICVRDITRRIGLQTELGQTRKMVALGEMAGTIAHHFNNILGGIVTSVDYARTTGNVAIQSRALTQVSQAIQRATALVNGLLAFAEGDRRADDLGDLTEIVTELADDIEQRANKCGIDFVFEMPNVPVIPVPRAQLATILQNITRNAFEVMPDGGKLELDVSVDAHSVIILVSDTGPGLDEAAKLRIFEPFWTTKDDAVTGGPGAVAGLGLAIAHGLVNMLGGTISVTSELGKGSRFRVTLPRTDQT
jgi:PAS domain S-box-containing protein